MPDEAAPDEAAPDGENEEPGRVKNRVKTMVVRYGIGVCQVCGNAARVRIGDTGRCPACGTKVTVVAAPARNRE